MAQAKTVGRSERDKVFMLVVGFKKLTRAFQRNVLGVEYFSKKYCKNSRVYFAPKRRHLGVNPVAPFALQSLHLRGLQPMQTIC